MDRAPDKPSRQSDLSTTGNPSFEVVKLREAWEHIIVDIIRQNLDSFEDAGSVLAASFRRLESFYQTYSLTGSAYFVIVEKSTGKLVGGAGIGPLAGLPYTEGVGEIRELVIQKSYRKKGLGAALLQKCLDHSDSLNYKRLYLETTTQMQGAQRLFQRFGFRPIQQGPDLGKPPCYYMRDGTQAT